MSEALNNISDPKDKNIMTQIPIQTIIIGHKYDEYS